MDAELQSASTVAAAATPEANTAASRARAPPAPAMEGGRREPAWGEEARGRRPRAAAADAISGAGDDGPGTVAAAEGLAEADGGADGHE